MTNPDTFDPRSIRWVLHRADLPDLDKAISEAEEVVIDLETTGLNEYATEGGRANGGVGARVSMASLTLPREQDYETGQPPTYVVPLSHPAAPLSGRWRESLRDIGQMLVAHGKPIVNQHLKFDLRWIYATTGVDLSHLFDWDTQIAAYLMDENQSTSLKEIVPRTFGVDRWDDHDLSTPGASERVPLFDLGIYAARDTYWTWRQANYQRSVLFVEGFSDGPPMDSEEVEDARLGKLMTKQMIPTAASLLRIENRGLDLDPAWVNDLLLDLTETKDAAFSELTGLYDMEPETNEDGEIVEREPSLAATSIWFRRWVDHAVWVGDLRIAELTPTGKPAWSASVLKRQARNGSEVAQKLLDYRGASKQAEFLTSWLDLATPDHKIHTTYWPSRLDENNQAGGTVTGRMSSSGPNVQQITKVLKPAFPAPPGFYRVEADYGQIELRIVAWLSGCVPMLDAFRRGDDLHAMMAARANGVDLAAVTELQRQAGKSANFGLVFGMGADGYRDYAEAAYGVDLTLDEAIDFHAAFYDLWDGIADWHAKQIGEVHRTGQVVNPVGRIRRLHDKINSWDHKEVAHAERVAINAPVQSFASELMQAACASINGTLPGHEPIEDAVLVGTVHDSILFDVPVETWEETTRACLARMTGITNHFRTVFGVDLDVPITADASVSTRWGLGDIAKIE